MDKLEEYKRRYLEESRAPDGTLSEETKKLGDEILFDYFKGDVAAFDVLIVSLNEEPDDKYEQLLKENEEMKQRQEMAEEALLNLSDMLLSR